MRVAGRGRILIWEGASLWLMEAPPGRDVSTTDFHSHHAIQVSLSLGGRLTLRTKKLSVAGNAVVAPDAQHLLEAEGHGALLFVEPESKLGRAIIDAALGNAAIKPIPDGRLGDLVERLKETYRQSPADEKALQYIGHLLLERLAGGSSGTMPDERVRKMMDHVASRLDGENTLADTAGTVGLSPSRARHLFVEQTGLSFRSYLLWLRITKALGIISEGRTLTEAAHVAGFADSAHFSRTFRRMFGIPAAALEIL
jgi:AraC-like DNA-binding protein